MRCPFVRPCPFCGGVHIQTNVYTRDGRKVAASVVAYEPDANAKSLEKWNRRVWENT